MPTLNTHFLKFQKFFDKHFNFRKIFYFFILSFLLCFGLAKSSFALRDEAELQLPTNSPNPAIEENKLKGGNFFSHLENTLDALKKKTDSATIRKKLFTSAKEIAKNLVKYGSYLAGGLALIYLLYGAFKSLSGDENLLQIIFDVGIAVGFCAYLLFNYDQLITQFDSDVLEKIRSVGGDPFSKVLGMYSAVFKVVGRAISAGFVNLAISFASPTTSFFIAVLSLAIVLLFSILIILVCILGLADLVGLIFLGPFLSAIGVAIGPLAIAGIVTPWTREYFKQWIGFIVAASFLTSILGIIINLATSLLELFDFDGLSGGDVSTAGSLIVILILISTINSLIAQAPSITNALVPGSFGAHSGGLKGASSLLNKGAEKGAGIAGKFAAKKAPGAAKATAKFAAGKTGAVASKALNISKGALSKLLN